MGRASGQYVQAASPDAVSPVLLLRVLDMPPFSNPEEKTSGYFADSEEFLSFFDEAGNPEAYAPVGLSFDKVSCDNGNKVVSFVLKLDNVSRDFCALASQVQIKGCRVELLRAFREDLSDPEAAQTIMAGSIQGWSITEYSIEADVTAPLNLPMRTPQRLYWPRCHWRFGGQECGYPDSCFGFWERWWKRTSSTYGTIDDTLTADLERISQGIDYSNINPGGQADYYNARILARLIPAFSETYTITVLHDDAVKVWIDGVLKINRWVNESATHTCTFAATAGVPVEIQIDHYEKDGAQRLRVQWSSASQSLEVIGSTVETVKAPASLIGAYASCGKTFADCLARGNVMRFGGFPHILRTRNPREVWTKT